MRINRICEAIMYKCTENDREKILDYISAEPEMNLFLYGDIESYGVDGEPVSMYAQERDGGWDSIILRYFDFFILYSRSGDYDAKEAADFINSFPSVDCVSGKTSLLRRMEKYFPQFKLDSTYMCRCNSLAETAVPELSGGAVLKPLGHDNVDEMSELLESIKEFGNVYDGEEGNRKHREQLHTNFDHGSIAVGVFVNGKIVSVASTSGANSISTMVVGVATAEGSRGRGYASAAVYELCRRSFADGKRFICLFYDNPDAGRIYRRLGFAELGEYAMIR